MAEVYVDQDASGANDGTSEADAYTDPVSALGVTAGDTLHIAKATADYAISTPLQFTGTGSITSLVVIIGYNTSFVIDGSRPVIDAGSTHAYCFRLDAAQDYFHIYNIEMKNATTHGITGATTTTGCVLINIWTHDCTATGINGFQYSRFINCISSANALGIKTPANGGFVLYCLVYDNSGIGIDINSNIAAVVSNCLIYDNGGIGLDTNHMTYVKNTVCHGNTGDNINVFSNNSVIDACRITLSGGYGIDGGATSQNTFVLNTYIPNTGEALANTSGATNGVLHTLANASLDLNDLVGTDLDGGYTDSTIDDYNTLSTASVYNGSIDMGDGVNFTYATAGLVPTASGGGGGGGGGALIDGDLVQ